MTDFRCSVTSRDDGEPIAGTAPTDTAFLLVEHAGSWGRKAVAESRLPEAVRDHLAGLTGVRVQLIRRHGGESGPGVRVFHARATPDGFDVRTVVLPDAEALLDLDLDGDLDGPDGDWAAYDAPLWLVCTNGRRDRCCAEVGRPITAALAGRWPEATWETTHLGGHRFAGTLLALPSGHTLGRLDVGVRRRGVRDPREGVGPRRGLPRPGRPHPGRPGARAARARRRRPGRRRGRGARAAAPSELRRPGREAHHALGGPGALTGLRSVA